MDVGDGREEQRAGNRAAVGREGKRGKSAVSFLSPGTTSISHDLLMLQRGSERTREWAKVGIAKIK